MNFFADEVESIEFESIPIQPSNVKTSLPDYTNTSAKIEYRNKNNTSSPSRKTSIITDNTTRARKRITSTNRLKQTTDIRPFRIKRIRIQRRIRLKRILQPIRTPTVKTDTTAKPIMLNVKVLADNTANGWTNSGWVVKKGQKIRINGKGQINLATGVFRLRRASIPCPIKTN